MKATAADPDVLDRCLLELAAESHFGEYGRALSAILAIMRDRGFERDDVNWRLEKLQKDGLVACRHVPSGREPLDDMGTVVGITTEGKDRLQRLRATSQFNIRLPAELQAELASLTGRVADSAGAVAIAGLREWVRMLKVPGIDFRWTPSGRKPHVIGTGLSVWELYRLWLDHGGDSAKLRANYPDLKPAQIEGARAYARAYLHEMPSGDFGRRPPFAQEVRV